MYLGDDTQRINPYSTLRTRRISLYRTKRPYLQYSYIKNFFGCELQPEEKAQETLYITSDDEVVLNLNIYLGDGGFCFENQKEGQKMKIKTVDYIDGCPVGKIGEREGVGVYRTFVDSQNADELYITFNDQVLFKLVSKNEICDFFIVEE